MLPGDVQATSNCPRSFLCNGSGVSFDIGPASSYVAIISSVFSCVGSLLILLVYALFEDVRGMMAQKIITLLAIADLVTAAGYILGSVNFLTHFNETETSSCDVFLVVCEVQSAITSWSSLCSFAWTFILSFHFYLVIVQDKARLSARLLPLYNLLAWGVPVLIILPLSASRKLGYAPYAASNWCYVKDNDYDSSLQHSGLTIFIVFIAGKFWEIVTYIVVPIFYIIITIHLVKARSHIQDHSSAVAHIEKRLLAIPLLFLLLRVWGTLQFFYSLGVSGSNKDGCIPESVYSVFMLFGILQAIGDTGQGWGNFILYILLSPTVRRKLTKNSCKSCTDSVAELLVVLLESESRAKARNTARNTASNRVRSRRATSHSGHSAESISIVKQDSEEVPLIGAVGYEIKRYETDSTTEVGPDSHRDLHSPTHCPPVEVYGHSSGEMVRSEQSHRLTDSAIAKVI